MSQGTQEDDVVGALEALRNGAELIRSNGKTPYRGLTKEMKARWAKDIEIILSSPQADLEVIWDDLALFPNDITVDGVANAWGNMSAELRNTFRKRLRLLHSEKGASQRFSLILHFLENDPMSALEMFCEMAPKNADNVKRAIKSLLVQDYQTIQRLFPEDAPVTSLAKAAELLVGLIKHDSVENKARWAVAKAIVSVLAQRNLLSVPIFADTIQELGTVARALPATYQADLKGLPGNWQGEEESRPPNEPPSVQPQALIAASPTPASASESAMENVSTSQAGPPGITGTPISSKQRESDTKSKVSHSRDWKAFITHWRDNLKNQAEMLDLLLSSEDPATVNSLREQLMEALKAQQQAEDRASVARLSADEFERKATEAAQRSRNLEERLNDLKSCLQRAESELADAKG